MSGPCCDPNRTASVASGSSGRPIDLRQLGVNAGDLRRTKLTFSVQPWVQQGSRRYRVDFIVYWEGRAVVVELDGKEGHIPDEDRQKDYRRERWLQAHGFEVCRWTGSDVYADAAGCVKQLLALLRGDHARG